MRVIVMIIFLFLIFFFSTSVLGIGGGYTGHIGSSSPWCGEQEVQITDKGVQTCVNVTVDQDCTVNLTFEWFNWSQYATDIYAGLEPLFFDESYWYVYGEYYGVNTSGQYCFYNENVSCATENWWTYWFDWRVTANFTCYGNYTFTEVFYCYFYPEPCPLFYIYPAWNSTDICPCCDAMCVGISNANGHAMNMTIYRNDSQFETFYVVNRYSYIGNETYCFCLDGYIDDGVYYPMRYNETYYWYVNVTDTVTGEYEISDTFQFTTAEKIEECPCGDSYEEESGGLMIIREYNLVLFLLVVCVVLVASMLTYHKYRK